MTATLTPEERKTARAQAERDRRERIKRIDAACERAGLTQRYADLVGDQRTRALDPDATGRHILFGTAGDEETDEQRLARLLSKTNGLSAKESQEVQRLRAKQDEPRTGDAPKRRRSSSSDAARALSEAGRKLGEAATPPVRSGWTPRQAQRFIDGVEVERALPTTVRLVTVDGDVTLNREELSAFGERGEKVPEVRRSIATLTRSTGRALWGRQFALLVLASLETNR